MLFAWDATSIAYIIASFNSIYGLYLYSKTQKVINVTHNYVEFCSCHIQHYLQLLLMMFACDAIIYIIIWQHHSIAFMCCTYITNIKARNCHADFGRILQLSDAILSAYVTVADYVSLIVMLKSTSSFHSNHSTTFMNCTYIAKH